MKWWSRLVGGRHTYKTPIDVGQDSAPPDDDLCYWAWTIIANADWSKETQEWQDGARRWRDAFHASIRRP